MLEKRLSLSRIARDSVFIDRHERFEAKGNVVEGTEVPKP
jgi:hypothetical protein